MKSTYFDAFFKRKKIEISINKDEDCFDLVRLLRAILISLRAHFCSGKQNKPRDAVNNHGSLTALKLK